MSRPRIQSLKPRIQSGHEQSWRSDKRSSSDRGYGYRWQQARAAFLARPENVLCRMCKEDGRITQAEVVDHITPHKGDQTLFWRRSNWQPLCKRCHDGRKQAQERGKTPQRIGLDGWPVDE